MSNHPSHGNSENLPALHSLSKEGHAFYSDLREYFGSDTMLPPGEFSRVINFFENNIGNYEQGVQLAVHHVGFLCKAVDINDLKSNLTQAIAMSNYLLAIDIIGPNAKPPKGLETWNQFSADEKRALLRGVALWGEAQQVVIIEFFKGTSLWQRLSSEEKHHFLRKAEKHAHLFPSDFMRTINLEDGEQHLLLEMLREPTPAPTRKLWNACGRIFRFFEKTPQQQCTSIYGEKVPLLSDRVGTANTSLN